ncbi:fixI [Symbiodinium microadriaticum]|nr:fixI [Symbiodinium microadriaticum]
MADTLGISHPASAGDFRDLTGYISDDAAGTHRLSLLVDGAHCANCIARIERTLCEDPAVTTARLNLASGRLLIEWRGRPEKGNFLAQRITDLGYQVAPFDLTGRDQADQDYEKRLVRALAVAGFGAANIMLMSVAMWSGAADSPATRALFHLLSAVIAVPVTAYAGLPFFTSALAALRSGGSNMDVPISLAVILAVGLSLVQITQGASHVWFESATMLLFFLLIGRLLDARARGQARGVVSKLLALRTEDAHVLEADGKVRIIPAEQVDPGMTLIVQPGAKVPVDGAITKGASEFDTSLITGERVPADAGPGDVIHAGTINLGVPVTMEAAAVRDDTLIAEITRLMEAAEQKRGQIVLLADRIAKLYVPVVHILALAAFLYWGFATDVGLTRALEITIAVLVITCPCALALAVPVVQVLASTRLMKAGVLIKSPSALERLAQIDKVVFDKTGTLTEPMLVPDLSGLNDKAKEVAAGLASVSHHPLARSLAAALPPAKAILDVEEIPGAGVIGQSSLGEMRLGRGDWVAPGTMRKAAALPELWLSVPGDDPVQIQFQDQLRPEAGETMLALQDRKIEAELLSGDQEAAVADMAARVGIADWQGDMRPADKVKRLQRAQDQGQKVLMVGDGLNDGPALSAAHVSMSPSSGTDLAQVAADAVFQSKTLFAVVTAIDVARRTDRLARQNIWFALLYNAIAGDIRMSVLLILVPIALLLGVGGLGLFLWALRSGQFDDPEGAAHRILIDED